MRVGGGYEEAQYLEGRNYPAGPFLHNFFEDFTESGFYYLLWMPSINP